MLFCIVWVFLINEYWILVLYAFDVCQINYLLTHRYVNLKAMTNELHRKRHQKKNKCIEDDTNRRSSKPKLHLKKQKNNIWRKTIFNMADKIIRLHPAMLHDRDIEFARWLHPAMWHVALESWLWIHQVAGPCNAISLWDGMPLNSPKRPPYWNSTPGFDFDHITAVDMSFCTSLGNFIQIGSPLAEKKWHHVDFQDGGSQPAWILGVQ